MDSLCPLWKLRILYGIGVSRWRTVFVMSELSFIPHIRTLPKSMEQELYADGRIRNTRIGETPAY
jgi:hypothetical protein